MDLGIGLLSEFFEGDIEVAGLREGFVSLVGRHCSGCEEGCRCSGKELSSSRSFIYLGRPWRPFSSRFSSFV